MFFRRYFFWNQYRNLGQWSTLYSPAKKKSTTPVLRVGVMVTMPLALKFYTGEVSVCACLFLCWSMWVYETGTGTIPLCARGPCWRSAWSVTLSAAVVTVTTGTLPIYTSSTLKACKVPSTLEARWRALLPFRPNNHVTTLRQMQMQQQCGHVNVYSIFLCIYD